jgi:2'-5' RNA ligase
VAGRLRLFFALPIPEKLARRLAKEVIRVERLAAAARWVPPEAYHVTLRFLGQVETEAVLELHDLALVIAGRFRPLELVARGLGGFPNPKLPRVVTCGVQGRDEEEERELQALREALDEGLSARGWHREKEPFRPHVTLGRIPDPAEAAAVGERLGPGARREFGHFRAPELVLFESRGGPARTRYWPLARVRLGSGARPTC